MSEGLTYLEELHQASDIACLDVTERTDTGGLLRISRESSLDIQAIVLDTVISMRDER